MASTLGALASALAGISRGLASSRNNERGAPPQPSYNPLSGGSANTGQSVRTSSARVVPRTANDFSTQLSQLNQQAASTRSSSSRTSSRGAPAQPAYNPLSGGSANTGQAKRSTSSKKAYVPPPPEARDPWWSPVGRNTNFSRGTDEQQSQILGGTTDRTGEQRRDVRKKPRDVDPKPLDPFMPQRLETYATPTSRVRPESTPDLSAQNISPTPTFNQTRDSMAPIGVVDAAPDQATATMQALINTFRSLGADTAELERFVPQEFTPQRRDRTDEELQTYLESGPPVSSMGPNVDFGSPVWDAAASMIDGARQWIDNKGLAENYIRRTKEREAAARQRAEDRTRGRPDWLVSGAAGYLWDMVPAVFDLADVGVDAAMSSNITMPESENIPQDLWGKTFSLGQITNATFQGLEAWNPFMGVFKEGGVHERKWDQLREFAGLNDYVANQDPEDRWNARPYWFSLGDPEKARGFVDFIVHGQDEAAHYERQAQIAAAQGDMVTAAQMGVLAEDIRSTNYYDAWWEGQNQWLYMGASVLNPLDAFALVKPIRRAWEPIGHSLGLIDDVAYQAKLIERGAKVSPEVATTIASIQQWRKLYPDAKSQEQAAALVVDDMVEAADKLLQNPIGRELYDAYRGFTSRKNLVSWLGSQTPGMAARRVADEFTDIFGVVAQGVKTTREVRNVIDSIMTGDAFITVPEPLFWGDFQKDFALIKAMAPDLKSLPSMADDVPLDHTKVMGEIQEAVELNVRRLLGDLPSEFSARARQIKVANATGKGNKGKKIVTYLDGDGNLIKATEPMTAADAKKLAAEHSDLLGKSLYDDSGALKIFEFGTRISKGIISTTHMVLSPAFSIRNAIWSYRRAIEQGHTGFRYTDEMLNYIKKLSGGWVLAEDMRALDRGDQAFDQISNLGEQMFAGKWRADSKVPNPLARTINLGRNITFGDTALKINLGKLGKWQLPWGETAQRGNFQDSGFRQAFDYLNHQAAAEMGDELANLGLDPNSAKIFTEIANEMGRSLGREELYGEFQKLLNGQVSWFSLRQYGINPAQFTGEQYAEIQAILQRHTPATTADLETDLMGFVQREIDKLIDDAYIDPPQPGSFVDTIQGLADDMGEFTADVRAFAGSLPPGEAEGLVNQAMETAARIIEKETLAWDTVRESLANSGRRIDLQNVHQMWKQLETEKFNVRLAADRINSQVVGTKDSAAHEAARTKVTQLWQEYERRMDEIVADFSGRLSEVTPEAGDTATDYMWDMMDKIARFDYEATLATAQRPIPPKDAAFQEEYEAIRNAFRDLIDNEVDRAMVIFGRYPTQFHLDEIIAAQRDLNRFGALTNRVVSKALRSESMSYDRYREFSDALWNGYRSFAEMRLRWASLRGSQISQGLGNDAAAAAGKVYNELDWLMPGIPSANDLNRMARIAKIPTASVTQAVEMSPAQARQFAKAIDKPGTMFETAYGPAELVKRMADRNGKVRVKVQFEDGTTRIIQGNNIGMPIQKAEDWLRNDPSGEVEKATKPIAAALNKAKQAAGELRPTTIVLLDGEVVNVSQTISRYGELQSLDGGNVPFYNLNVVQELRHGDEVVWTRPEGYEFPRLVQPSDSRIPVGPERVAPSPYVNNLVRKYADEIGLSAQTQETIATMNRPEDMWAALADDEKRQVFNFLYVRGKDAGADVVREWYDSKFPNMTEDFFGLTGKMDFFKFMDMAHANTKMGGSVIEVPTGGAGAAYDMENLLDAAAKIIGNAEEILQPQTLNPVPPNLRLQVQGAVNNFLKKRDNNIYSARQAGQDAVNRSIFGYNDQYVIDKIASNFMLYHYFQTRAVWNFAKRTWREPRQAAQIYRWQRAVEQEWQQNQAQGAPTRLQDTVPFPLRTLATNLGVPDEVSRYLPNRAYNPIALLFPLNLVNEFVDPSQEQGKVAKTYAWMRRLNILNNPMITIPMDIGLQVRDNMTGAAEGQIPRTADYGAYNYLPFSRTLGGLWKATYSGQEGWQSRVPGAQAGGALPPKWLDSPYSHGLLQRQIMNLATKGTVTSQDAAFAYGLIEAERYGLELPPEYTDDIVEAARDVITQATNDLGKSQLAREFVRGATGLATQDLSEEEAWVRQFQMVYRSLGYSEENPNGSRAAQNAFLKQSSEELGQPVDDLQRLLYDYPKGYSTSPDETPLSIQALQTAMFNELQPTYEAETLEIFDALMTGGLTDDGMDEIEKKFRDMRTEIYDQYPSLEDYRRETNQPYTYGMNPYEEAQARLWAKIGELNDRKPEWPGEEVTDPVTWYEYYEGMGKWKIESAESLSMWFEDASRYDPLPNDSEWKTPAYMGMVGRYPQEIMDAYDFRNDSAPEIVWRIDDRIEAELTGPASQARDERVMDAFGEDGFRLFKEYQDKAGAMRDEYGQDWYNDAPEDAKQDYYDWQNDNPELEGIKLYAYDPAAYVFVTDRWGEQVFEDNANYPRGGPKGSWKKYAREIGNSRWNALTAYWDWKDDRVYEQNAQLFDPDIAGEFLTYKGQRPYPYPGTMAMGQEPLGDEKRDEYLTRYYMDKLGSSIDLEEYQRSGEGGSYISSLIGAMPRNIRGELMFEGIPGVTAPPATTPTELPQFLAATGDKAAENYVLSQPGGEAKFGLAPEVSEQALPIETQVQRFLEQELSKAELKKLEEEGDAEAKKASSSGSYYSKRYARRYYGRRSYRRRGYRRYYGRRNYYRRYRSGWRSRYGRGGGGGGGYGGGYGGGSSGSQYVNMNVPDIYPEDASNWMVQGAGQVSPWQPSFMSWSSWVQRRPEVNVGFRRLT